MATQSAVMNVMIKAARKAARDLKRDFGEIEGMQVARKGPADFVSTADLRTEKIIKEELSIARPGFGFLMEESGTQAAAEGEDRRWIVDPLDGTTNFLHGLPHFAISIALEEKGEIIAALVYDPIKEDSFTAEKGQGAFLNNRRIRVSKRRDLADCLMATGIPFKGKDFHEESLKEVKAVIAETSGVRRWGTASLDLAYVAAGRFDGFWEHGLQAWDIAAGLLLVREAGGVVAQIGGASHKLNSPSILAANPEVHSTFDRLVAKATKN